MMVTQITCGYYLDWTRKSTVCINGPKTAKRTSSNDMKICVWVISRQIEHICNGALEQATISKFGKTWSIG